MAKARRLDADGSNHTVITHQSVTDWASPRMWEAYLDETQSIVGDKLKYLDSRDPMRRKAQSFTPQANASFITALGAKEQNRFIFGKFDRAPLVLEVFISRYDPESFNGLGWSIKDDPDDTAMSRMACRLFDLGNRILKPFYAYCDTVANLQTKEKANGFGIDPETELKGVFWLTYFNNRYRRFFGAARLRSIAHAKPTANRGIRIQLGESPGCYDPRLRLVVEEKLGRETFVNPRSRREKEPGNRHVLSFDALRQ